MSYQVLARKWRPRNFESLVGQEHVVRALTHALTENRLHHAYLFTGTRGVGKTTLARILAKALNCETGVTATPCGQCSSCLEIDAGRFVDLLEVDAATNTKVDEMRQLLENAVYAPTRGRFKVYVIDEVHMLSNSAFNAMLKTLEEPPEHVKFILATTDPQKIPVTVLSRCMQFNLKQMTPPLIAKHLKHILEIEGISADAGSLNLLSHSASGSMRDALSLLDQAIAHGAGQVEEAQVRDMLGSVDQDYLFSILDALIAGDAVAMVGLADDMALRSLSFDTALSEFSSLLTHLQIAQLAPQAIAEDLPERARLLELSGRLDPEYIQLAYQIVIHGRKELSLAPDEQAGFVMTLLRLHAFRPAIDSDVALSPPSGAVEKKAPAAAVSQALKRDVVPDQRVQAERTPVVDAPVIKESAPQKPVVPEPILSPPATVQMESTPQEVVVSSEPAPPTIQSATPPAWNDMMKVLPVTAMVRELGQHCELVTVGEKQLVLNLSPQYKHLLIKSSQERLAQAVSDYFGRSLELQIRLEAIQGETPAAVEQREKKERLDEAARSIDQDEFVQKAIEMFDATLITSSIKPV